MATLLIVDLIRMDIYLFTHFFAMTALALDSQPVTLCALLALIMGISRVQLSVAD